MKDGKNSVKRWISFLKEWVFTKFSSKGPAAHLQTILLPCGEYAGSEKETLNQLLNKHYPGSKEEIGNCWEGDADKDWAETPEFGTHCKSDLSRKVELAVKTFELFKTPGVIGVYLAFLKKGLRHPT